MLDNPWATAELIEMMTDSLPMSAMIPPSLAKIISEKKPGIVIPRIADITEIHYLGDDGGIMCVMTLKKADETKETVVVSLTHLKIDGRHPLSRRIVVYQKRRTKKLAQERTMMEFAQSYGMLNTRANI